MSGMVLVVGFALCAAVVTGMLAGAAILAGDLVSIILDALAFSAPRAPDAG